MGWFKGNSQTILTGNDGFCRQNHQMKYVPVSFSANQPQGTVDGEQLHDALNPYHHVSMGMENRVAVGV